jgi:hypothetical protein
MYWQFAVERSERVERQRLHLAFARQHDDRSEEAHLLLYILTGGIAYSKYCVEEIKKQVSFLAPVIVLPGEGEMESLAFNALGALNGELPVHEYK